MMRWLVWLLLLAPRAAQAAEEGAAHFTWELVNLALLIGVLIAFARKPVLRYLEERQQGIRSSIETSEQLLRDSESQLARWNERAARLDAEREEILATTRRSAEQQAREILEQANATAERIRHNAAAVVERELRQARARLQEEAAEAAVQAAARILRERITGDDRQRLVQEFISAVAAGGDR